MPKASTKAMSAESILETAIDIPDDIGAEVIKLLFGGRVTAKADLAVIDAFVKAAIAVTKLPSYEVMIEEDEVEKHCVRCHGVFSDMTNDSDACVIPHVFSSDDYYRGGPNCGIVYSSICCRSGVTVEGDETGGGGFYHVDRLRSCYKGFHTTNPKNVEQQYNEINIFPCAMKGGECLRWDLYNKGKGEPVDTVLKFYFFTGSVSWNRRLNGTFHISDAGKCSVAASNWVLQRPWGYGGVWVRLG